MKTDFSKVSGLVDGYKKNMAETLGRIIEIKAISPKSGGTGEAKRADFLQSLLKDWGFEPKRYDYIDDTRTKRSNLVAKFGKCKKTLWVITHMDTVSEGDRSLWHTDPFKPKISGGKVYGRGANDNGQAVIAGLFALKALKDSGAGMQYNIGIAIAADEELGGRYGMQKLVREGIFKHDDYFVVSDFGNTRGDEIEIEEKGVLWLKITVKGKQVHASTPQLGVNAYRYAMRFLLYLDEYLHKKYNAKDRLYKMPSTFEMTKHEKNVDSTNIVPGIDVSYLDCRILPKYSPEAVLSDIKRIARMSAFKKAKINVDVVNMETAPRTDKKSEIARMLGCAIKELRGIDVKYVGMGGGTDAKPLRQRGIDAVAWGTQHDIAHQPNEFAETKEMVDDAKVFAYLCLTQKS
ncbi:MAG: M20 family metallo-hydrolase [Candidatus Micrarchaeales archaeon]